jgi:PAS domain S-box-containing protein
MDGDKQRRSADLSPEQIAKANQAKRLLEADLRDVCASKGFELEYQPQVNLRTQRVTTFEALLRWRHPVRGNVPPAEFIPLAEEIGLIGEIGQWVLERACQDAVAWPPDIRLAVNVSPLQLNDAAMPALVAAALRLSGLAPSRLELELTESVAMPEGPACLAALQTIRNSGVGIVMDDFDIGYSGLGSLLEFPFTKVKIDRSFIEKLPQDEHRHKAAIAIVRSIIGLCKEMEMTCLAEGVETEEQLRLLMEANCTEVQGYLVGRPKPSGDIPDILQKVPALLRGINIGNSTIMGARQQSASEQIPFSQIVETANDIIIVTTPELAPPGPVITYVNAAFTRLTGYSAAEAIGLTPRILQGPGTSRATLDRIKAELQAGRPAHEKILNFGKSGAPYWLDLHIVALRNPQGAITHFAAIERDVTMDKRRLDELEHLADRDTLTGIPNRRAFLHAIKSECDAAVARGMSSRMQKAPV